MANIKYQGTSYEDWYKHHFADPNTRSIDNIKFEAPKKTEGMSDADYQIGQALYRSYLENQRLDSEYGNGVKALDKAKDDAEISADITLQRMQKYLPQQLAKQGLYGTGMSEDAYLRLQNQYQQSVSDAAKSYTDGLSRLESAYQQNKNSVWEQANSGVNTVVENAQTAEANNYISASDGLVSGTFTTAKEIEDYIKSYEGKVSAQDYTKLKKEAVSVIKGLGLDSEGLTDTEIKNAVDASKLDTVEASDFDSLKNGDDIKVKLGDIEYTVESDGEAQSAEPANYAAENGVKDGSLFVYGDNNDVYIYSGGVAYKVVSKSNNPEKRAMYNDVRQYLLGQGKGVNLDTYNQTKKGSPETRFRNSGNW